MIGEKYGKLTVLKEFGRNKYGVMQYLCQCDCGGTKVTLKQRLKCGDTKTCGCKKHSESKTLIYGVWVGIKKRCLSGQKRNAHRYKDRGIGLCLEWQDFLTFKDWAVKNGYEEGLQIDRIDNNKGYSPENCRFVHPKTNSQNQERCKYWIINGIQYNSSQDAAEGEKVSKVTIQRWCKGYFSKLRNRYYMPKKNCYTIDKYKGENKCKQ